MDMMRIVTFVAQRRSALDPKFGSGQVEGFGYASRFAMRVLATREGVIVTMLCHETSHTFVVMMVGHNPDDQHDKGGQAYKEYGELLSHERHDFGTKIRFYSCINRFFADFRPNRVLA